MASAPQARAFLFLCLGVGLYFVLLLLGLPGLACPVHALSGLDCPGCGITRAGLAVLRLDLAGAVRWNPLIVFLVPFLLWRALESAWVLGSGRSVPFAWPRWWTRGVQYAFVSTWLAVATSRLFAWAAQVSSLG